ncbi:protein CHROMATIN REMODELING 4 [Senna tora]|uniref:Protein CHROMATIN REMODELING 4 n=1 Tax=Senna tora TaxID=362788 RepID=A0A834TUJ5_9FABA|nr:protein CHROMATIN REMODELING 4 [Senna tora]
MESFSHNKKNGGQHVSKSKRQCIAHNDEQKSFSNKALSLTSYLELKTRAIGTDGNEAGSSGDASSKSYGKNIDITMPTSVEKVTWFEFELDALLVGVRRYGQDNWDTILANTSLRVLKDETPQDLCMKWKEELHKILSSFRKSTPIGILETPPSFTSNYYHGSSS